VKETAVHLTTHKLAHTASHLRNCTLAGASIGVGAVAALIGTAAIAVAGANEFEAIQDRCLNELFP
jgi:hypothetical protein